MTAQITLWFIYHGTTLKHIAIGQALACPQKPNGNSLPEGAESKTDLLGAII
jgi:hypothetical protein